MPATVSTSCARHLGRSDALTRRHHGSAKDDTTKEWWPKVWQGRQQERRERDAPAQEWHAQAREERSRRDGEEQETGNSHRALGSSREGRQGPVAPLGPIDVLTKPLGWIVNFAKPFRRHAPADKQQVQLLTCTGQAGAAPRVAAGAPWRPRLAEARSRSLRSAASIGLRPVVVDSSAMGRFEFTTASLRLCRLPVEALPCIVQCGPAAPPRTTPGNRQAHALRAPFSGWLG